MGVKPGENVLIVAELSKMAIAESVANAVFSAGAIPMVITMIPRERDGQEPPALIAAAMAASDAFVCCVQTSITHTHAVKNAWCRGFARHYAHPVYRRTDVSGRPSGRFHFGGEGVPCSSLGSRRSRDGSSQHSIWDGPDLQREGAPLQRSDLYGRKRGIFCLSPR